MSDFINNIVKLAREYRASEQDAHSKSYISRKRKDYQETKNNFETIRKQLIDLILRTFNSTTSSQMTHLPTDIRSFCSQHNLYGKLDYHHFHGNNNIPVSSFINTSNNAKTAQEIIDTNVVPNMRSLDEIYTLNNQKQQNFLWSVLRVELKSCYAHMKDQMHLKNNPFSWEQQIETLGEIYNPVDFFQHLSAMIINYQVPLSEINKIKTKIVEYLSTLKNIQTKP